MKILIADDDPIIRQVLMNLLSKWDYEVVPATNGAQAWAILQQDPSLRIGLFDWFMPEINGIELTRQIRDANITPFHIILCTARSGKEGLLDAFAAGVDDFVTKPFDKEILQARIKAGVRSVELQSYLIKRLAEAEWAVQSAAQLREFVAVCSGCGNARDLQDRWRKIQLPFAIDAADETSYMLCPDCSAKMDATNS